MRRSLFRRLFRALLIGFGFASLLLWMQYTAVAEETKIEYQTWIDASIYALFSAGLLVFSQLLITRLNWRKSGLKDTLDGLSMFAVGVAWIVVIASTFPYLYSEKTYAVAEMFSKELSSYGWAWSWIVLKNIGIVLGIALVPAALVYAREYVSSIPSFNRDSLIGQLSTGFASLYQFRKATVKIKDHDTGRGTADHIFLGRTLFKDDPFHRRTIGVSSDSNVITIGMIGSGKAATSAWHNLAMYQGSMIVFDPKGEHARMTFKRRQMWCKYPGSFWKEHKGVDCYDMRYPAQSTMLDPFGVNADTDIPASRYNPLADIDLSDESNAMKLIVCIADGCIIPDNSDKGSFFTSTAKNFLTALIGHVLTAYPEDNHNLPFVYDLFYGVECERTEKESEEAFNNLLLDMMNNQAFGNKIRANALDLYNMGDNTLGSVLPTIALGLDWIADPKMRHQLSGSDFSLKDFGTKRVEAFKRRSFLWMREKVSVGKRDKIETLYIVLPFERMQKEPRWMRVMSSLCVELIAGERNTSKILPKIPTTILLDEFAQLGGRVDSIVNAFNYTRSTRLKLWIMLQNLAQIQKQYPNKWNDMMSGSAVQLFGVNDTNTAKYFSERLGKALFKTTKRKGWRRKKHTEEHVNEIFSIPVIMDYLGKGVARQLCFTPSGTVFNLERVGFKTYTDRDGNKFHGIETTKKVEHIYDID